MIFGEPRGRRLIRLYKDNYGIAEDAVVTEAMILEHWELEKALTLELLASIPANRREVFERCYSTLYARCDWLNKLIGTSPPVSKSYPDMRYAMWTAIIGSEPKRIYEVGSGRGELIAHLTSLGHDCTATEITRERGAHFTAPAPHLRWALTDGVHLDLYEKPESYDIVLSDQVIEHLHPDDLETHFATALTILKPGGMYLFCTPHVHLGPNDVSRVFGTSRPQGMHLREYGYADLVKVSLRAGFCEAGLPSFDTGLLHRVYSLLRPNNPASLYLVQHRVTESLVSLFPLQSLRRLLWRTAGRWARLREGVFLFARKTD